MSYPNIEKAKEIYLAKFYDEGQLFHALGVAESAQKIAQRCGLDVQKAYVFGLLHDYGYTAEKTQPDFHGKIGHEEMQKLGFDEVAKICLTHSFPHKDFGSNNFKPDWLAWARDKLQLVEYDDYDCLIQLCDMFFGDFQKFCIEDRVKDITARHKISEEKQASLLNNAKRLKDYFDNKCGCDVYDLLEIKP